MMEEETQGEKNTNTTNCASRLNSNALLLRRLATTETQMFLFARTF